MSTKRSGTDTVERINIFRCYDSLFLAVSGFPFSLAPLRRFHPTQFHGKIEVVLTRKQTINLKSTRQTAAFT